jgi:hypothetical protein
VPPALTTLLSFSPGDGLVAHETIGTSAADGAVVCAAFGRRNEIAALIDALAAAGCPLDSVLPAPLPALRVVTEALRDEPEVVFLDAAPAAPTLALLRSGSPCLLRVLRHPGKGDAARAPDAGRIVDELRWTLAAAAGSSRPPVVVGGAAETVDAIVPVLRARLDLPVRRLVDVPISAVPHGLRSAQGAYAAALGLALGASQPRATRHGFEVSGSSPGTAEARAVRREVRRTRAIAAAVLGLLMLHSALDWTLARRRLHRAERIMQSGLAAVSPPDDAISSIAELRERVAVLEAGCGGAAGCTGPLEFLQRLSGAIPAGVDVVLERVEIDGGTALVEGRAASGAVVDQLRAALGAFGDLVTTNPDGAAGSDDTDGTNVTSVTFRLQTNVAADTAPRRDPTAPADAKAVDA